MGTNEQTMRANILKSIRTKLEKRKRYGNGKMYQDALFLEIGAEALIQVLEECDGIRPWPEDDLDERYKKLRNHKAQNETPC